MFKDDIISSKEQQTISSYLKARKTAPSIPHKLISPQLENMKEAKSTPTKKNNNRAEDTTGHRRSIKKVASKDDNIGVVAAKKRRSSKSINPDDDMEEDFLDDDAASTSMKATVNKSLTKPNTATTSEISMKIEDDYEEPELQEWPNNWNQTTIHDIKEHLLSGAYKLIPINGRSKVWELFGKIEDNEGAEITERVGCRICYAVYTLNPRTTSNLVRHKCYVNMKEKHKTAMAEVHSGIKKEAVGSKDFCDETLGHNWEPSKCNKDLDNARIMRSADGKTTINNRDDIKEYLLSGAYKLLPTNGRSKIWQVYGKIADNKGVEIAEKVGCRTCLEVYKFNPRTTSNLVRHKCYVNMKEEHKTPMVEVYSGIKNEAVEIEDFYEEPLEQKWEPNKWYKDLDNTRTMLSDAPVDEDDNADEKTTINNRDDIKEHLLSGAYKLLPTNGRSKIWQVYGKIADNKGVEIAEKVGCRTCMEVYKFNPRTTSNLVRHKCYVNMKDEHKTPMVEVHSGIKNEVVEIEDFYEVPLEQKWEPNKWYKDLDNTRTMLSVDDAPADDDDNADEKTAINDSVVDDASLNKDDIREHLLSGAYKLIPKIGRSKVWEVYGKIEDSEGAEIAEKVGCRNCFAVLKFFPKTTSNLIRHKCYLNKLEEQKAVLIDVHDDIKKELLRLFSQWCIENCRPLQFAQDSGLKRIVEFMASIGAKYGANVDIDKLLPQATSISLSMDQLFDVTLAYVKNDIQENCINGYGLTSDLWTDSCLQQSYTCLTIHYIKQGQLVTKLLGLNAMDDDKSSSVSFNIQIQRWLSDYSCKLEDAIMVTGRDANMMTAFNQFTHNYCINHLLNNAVNKSIEQVEEITELYNSCSKLLEHLKISETNFSFDTIPQIQCATRWHTVFYLLDAVEKNWLAIVNKLERNNQQQRIENINLHYIKGLVQVLQPFEQTSTKLEVQSHATLHLVYPYISGLKDTCIVHNDDVDVIKRLKESLSERLQAEVMENMTVTHKIALFLFPPANKLPHFSIDERCLVKSECARQLKPYCYNEAAVTAEPASVQSKRPQKNATILSSYFTNFISPAKNVNSNDKISEEIQAYEMLNVPFEDNFDIINWWHLRRAQFPLLYKLSCKILATPASKASSDRVVASAKQLLCEKRSSLSYIVKTFKQIVFLNFNADKTLLEDHKDVDIYL